MGSSFPTIRGLKAFATLALLPMLMPCVSALVLTLISTDITQGKTTTTERMLYHSGRIRHLGSIALSPLCSLSFGLTVPV